VLHAIACITSPTIIGAVSPVLKATAPGYPTDPVPIILRMNDKSSTQAIIRITPEHFEKTC
jgi:hypothetical protein